MFKSAGSGLLLYCDSEAQLVRVGTNVPLVEGFRKTFLELDVFSNEKDWMASQYYNQVTDKNIQDEILWFWIDLEKVL